MAKLVVVTPDNSVVDVPLDRERLTIGRRPDNDLCLPYPAVSGEHAAIVTILADSFLEDLDSTNGTLVNGKPVVKHFLRDRDAIEIGKQTLVYLADDADRYEPDRSSLHERSLAKGVEPATHGIAAMRVSSEIDSMAAEIHDDRKRALPPLHVGVPGGGFAAPPPVHAPTSADTELTQSLPPVAWIKVLTGPNAGRSLPLVKDETTVGRVGVSIAAVRKSAQGFVLVPLESNGPVRVNGHEVGKAGSPLSAGDEIEIAGTKLQFVPPAKA